jgi:hypothetical protein
MATVTDNFYKVVGPNGSQGVEPTMVNGTLESAVAPVAFDTQGGMTGYTNQGNPNGSLVGGRVTFSTPEDFTIRQYVTFQCRYERASRLGNLDTWANGGARIIFFDSAGNFARFHYHGGEYSNNDPAQHGWAHFRGPFNTQGCGIVIDLSRTPDNESGTMDWTDVDGYELHLQLDAGENDLDQVIGRIALVDDHVLTGTGGTFQDFNDYNNTNADSDEYQNRVEWRKITPDFDGGLGDVFAPRRGFSIGDGTTATAFSDTGTSIYFYPSADSAGGNTPHWLPDDSRTRVCTFDLASADELILVQTVFAAYDDGTKEADVIFTGNSTDTDNKAENLQFFNLGYVQLDTDVPFTGPIFDNIDEVEINGNTDLTGGIVRNAANYGMRMTAAAADYSAITVTFESSNTFIDLLVGSGGAGTYDFSGLAVAGGHTLHIWNESTSNSVTVDVASGISTQKIDLWFNYDNEASGPFTEGETLTFGNGATATLARLVDSGTTGTMYCELLTGSTPPDNNSITGGTSSATANVDEASGANSSTLTISQAALTLSLNSDTASTLIRYFTDDSQTIVDSATGITLDYDYTGVDPIDVEFLKQGYVPYNRQNLVPFDGDFDVIMDFDESYNSSHGLVKTTNYTYNRATKALAIVQDQQALDVRSALADLIRTDSAYYNTALLMVSIPGLTRVDLTEGMTISSMATWKGAGMERFDAADSANPVEKWVSIKSVGTITGASVYYRQTNSGNATAGSLTNNVVDEAFQYYSDPNHDGSTADGYDYSGYFIIKTVLAGSKQARVDVLASAGVSALASNAYTVGLTNESHGYSGTDPGISADLTLVAGGTVGGEVFAYEWVDGGTNSETDIANQIHYNSVTTPNAVIPGGTGLRYFELPDMVIFNGSNVETANGFEEGATPTLVGFYVSRGGSDHPGFSRFQADNGDYYIPETSISVINTNLVSGWHVKIVNTTQATTLFNADLAGSLSESFTFGAGKQIESGDSITYYAMRVSGTNYWQPITGTAIASGGDITFLDAVEVWTDVENWGWDSTPVTGDLTDFTADATNIDIDIDDSDGISQRTRVVSFWAWMLTQSSYIEEFWGAYTVFASNNIRQNDTVVDVLVHNTGLNAVYFDDNDVRYYRESTDLPYDTAGSSIFMDYTGVPDVVETGVSGLTAPESVQLSTIATVDTNVDLLIQDQGLDAANPKTITENTAGTSYDETFDTVTKEIRKSGSTTTITRTT